MTPVVVSPYVVCSAVMSHFVVSPAVVSPIQLFFVCTSTPKHKKFSGHVWTALHFTALISFSAHSAQSHVHDQRGPQP